MKNTETSLYGIVAEFDSPEALLEAAKKTAAKGYVRAEAYSPFPVEGIDEVLRIRDRRIPLFVLIAGIAGAVGGFLLQYFASVIDYPIRVGGKPLNSWPSFIPVTFELTILCAAVTAVLSVIFLNGFPMPYHPVFNVKSFERATLDRFFLCIPSTDPRFDRTETRKFLTELKAEAVEEVAL